MAETTQLDIAGENPESQTGQNGSLSASDVIERYNAGVKPLRSHHFNYWMNDAYVVGDQWLTHDANSGQIQAMPTDEDRVQATINEMWPASRTIIAKSTERPLQFYVPATGADDASLKGARTAESILVNLHREHDWEGLREDVHWAAWKGGTGVIRIVWDAEAGSPLGMDHETGKSYSTGDTCEDVLAITDFVVEPGARDAEHARWWIVCIGLPPKEVQEMFDLADVPPADAGAATSPFHKSVQGMGTEDLNTPLTKVYTLYQRPCKDMPEGRVVSVVNNAIVDDVKWPFPFKDRLNFVTVRETRKEGTWVGETVLKSARPIQNAINHAWSSIIEHLKLAGNARLMVPHSMMDTINELTDLAGEIVPFPDNSQNQMGYMTPPVMPNWWVDAPDRLVTQMNDILGVHDVSRGDAPGRVDSGLGISILSENNDTPVGRFVKDAAGAFGRLASMALQIYEANVKETRKAIVKTPGQPSREYRWTGKDLKGQTVASVPTDAVTPRNKAADEAKATKMLDMGLIKTVDEWHKVAQVPMDRDVLEAISPDTAKARRENVAMDLGEIQVPEAFDDHVTHIAEHLTMMKSAEWDLMDDKIRQMFKDHNKAHEILAAEAMGRQVGKMGVNPALATSASATGDPLPPAPALGTVPGGGPLPPPPPAAGTPGFAAAAGAPLPGDPNVAGMVSLDNPGVDPGVIQQELGPVQGI